MQIILIGRSRTADLTRQDLRHNGGFACGCHLRVDLASRGAPGTGVAVVDNPLVDDYTPFRRSSPALARTMLRLPHHRATRRLE